MTFDKSDRFKQSYSSFWMLHYCYHDIYVESREICNQIFYELNIVIRCMQICVVMSSLGILHIYWFTTSVFLLTMNIFYIIYRNGVLHLHFYVATFVICDNIKRWNVFIYILIAIFKDPKNRFFVCLLYARWKKK